MAKDRMYKKLKLLVCVAVAMIVFTPAYLASAADAATWQVQPDGNWSNSASWSGGIPNSSSADAIFPDVSGAFDDTDVDIDGQYSVGSLILTNSGAPDSYRFNCSAPDSISVYSAITSSGLSPTIACPLVLRGNVVVSGTNNIMVFYSDISGDGGFTLDAPSGYRMYLTGTNTYTGPTIINSGTFQAGYDNTFSPYSDYTLANSADAILQIGGPIPVRIGSLTGGAASIVDLWGGTLTVGNSNDTIYAGTITNGSGGASSLIKQGSGKLTLAGSNTYTGTTSVNEGTLVIDGSLASSEVTVASGATLKGAGTLPAVTLHGIIAPGNSIGTLSGTDFTFASGSTLENEINASGQTDLVEASSSITIEPGSTLKIIPEAGTYTPGQTYTIVKAPSINGAFSSVIDSSGSLNYELKYYPDRIDIVINAATNVASTATLADTGMSRPTIVLIATALVVSGSALAIKRLKTS